ncbi:MAG: glycosyltransferase family 39 protein [Nanoarchaeota archaeon]|nr:glycosyltransferase family 39 protein [Nanoarchaeota archaeon]MBU1269483.1 glycosyltransferase family 39 protein [Nanoarchaeota archaeon]MBU2443653.1 glycosyltransferase family 39 protein [Nanoarchaeota archaeon]
MKRKKHPLPEKSFFKHSKKIHFLGFLLIATVTLLAYCLLIKNSSFDQTMLYSWAWIVNYLNVKLFFVFLILVFVISFFVSKIDFNLKDAYFLIIIFVLSFSLSSMMWSSPDPNPDVAEFFGVAKYIELNGLWDYVKNFGTENLKGYRFHSLLPIIGLSFLLFGESPFIVHIIASILYAFIPVLVFLLSKKLFNRKIAIISSFFVISMPFLLVQSSMFLVDVPTVFFVLLALLTFYVFLHKNKVWYYFLTVITLLFAITSKRPAVLFLLLSFFVLFLIVKQKTGFHIKHLSIKAFIIFYVLFIIIFFFVFFKIDFFSNQITLDISQANIIGKPPHYENILSYFFQIHPLIMLLFIVFLVFFAFKPTLSKLFLFVWIFFPYIFLYNTTIRYMLPAFPAILIAAAFVLSKFKKPIVIFAISVIFLSSLLSVIMGYIPLLKNEFYDNNIKLAADYTNKLGVYDIGVYMFYKDLKYKASPKTEIYGYVFDYYSNKRVYYDISESVKQVYSPELGLNRFNVFEYYENNDYLNPDYDAVVVFSNTQDYQTINDSDIKQVAETLNKSYNLNKTFSVGKSGIEENKFAFIYIRE